MPDVSALGEYMEIFENPAMSGLIMLQTVVAGVSAVSLATRDGNATTFVLDCRLKAEGTGRVPWAWSHLLHTSTV